MKKTTIIFIILCLTTIIYAQPQSETHFWQGYLNISETDSLKLVMLIEYEKDTISFIELDSPDQFAFEMRADTFSAKNDSLYFYIKSLNAAFSGVKDGSNYNGTFTQNRKKFPLYFSKTTIFQRFPPRPQTPKKPYPYLEEEIEMQGAADNTTIKGTLTMPREGKPKGLVITVTGSGWQDRDQTIYGHKTFLVLADFLTRNGYAVYRYDDPPIHQFRNMTSLDFQHNLQEVANYFICDDRFRDVPIGFLGHSEGGTIACMAADAMEDDEIQFVISLAAGTQPFAEIITYQSAIISKEMGYSDEHIELIKKSSLKILNSVKKSKDLQKAKKNYIIAAEKVASKLTDEEQAMVGVTPIDNFKKSQSITPWFYYLLQIDLAKVIKGVTCPVFAINGEKDSQVYYKENLAIFSKNLPSNIHHLNKSYPNLNHLFQTSTTGSVREYKEIEETISPLVLHDILHWLNTINE